MNLKIESLRVGNEIVNKDNEVDPEVNKQYLAINHGLVERTEYGLRITKDFLGEKQSIFISQKELEALIKWF